MIQKKAQAIAMETWVKLALVVLVIIILAVLYVTLVKNAGTYWEASGCKNSNLQNTLFKKGSGVFSSNVQTPIDCPTYDITFYETKVTQSLIVKGKETLRDYPVKVNGETTTKFKKLDNEVVNYVMAEELASCWNKFLEGKDQVLLDNFPWENDGGDNNEACFICDNIRFASGDVTQNQFTGFYDYLHYALYDSGQAKKTYYDYVINTTRQCYMLDYDLDNFNSMGTAIATGFVQEMNDNYGYNLQLGHQYTAANLPPDACWNLYVDGLKSYQNFNHEGIVKDINFFKTETYHVVFIRMGLDKNSATYFAYILPSSQLGKNCNQIAI
jgi:hypothetical protein